MTSPSAPATTLPAGAILALSLAAFASAISMRLADALLPRLADEFAVSLGAASAVITCFSVAYGFSQWFFGPVGDRYGKYRVIAWACVACTVTASLCGLAPSLPLLLLARLAAGATAAAVIPLSMAFIGDVVPYEQRQPVLARFLIGQILGVSAGVLVGGYTAEHLDWRVPFFGIALSFACISLLLFSFDRRLPDTARGMRAMQGSAWQRLATDFRHILSLPWARVVLATVFLEGAFVFGAFAFVASFLHHAHGLPLSQAGLLIMLFGFGGLLFALTAAPMVRRLGESGLTWWGGILIGLSYATISLSPTWHWVPPACFIAGLGFYMLHNTLQINATQMAPDRRGAAVSAFASCFFLGQSAGVASAGFLIMGIDVAGVILLGGIGVAAVAVNFSRLRRRRLVAGS